MNILLATDGSRCADAAAQMLFCLGLPAGARVKVMTVLPKVAETPRLSEATQEVIEAASRAHEDAAAQLTREMAKAFAVVGCQGDAAVLHGRPADQIVRAACGTDLVVLGAKGRADIKKFMLGDVSQKVVRYAPTSVLVVRPFPASDASSEFLPTRPTPLRVLVATDGSEYVAAGIALLSRFRLHPQTQISVAHVIKRFHPLFAPRVAPGMRSEYQRAMREIREEEDGAATRIVTQAQETLASTGVHVDTFVIEGEPAEQVVSLTRTRKPHLVVVGSSGLTGIKAFLLGSVSQKVVKYTACSVLVARHGAAGGVSPLTETTQESEKPTWSPLLD